MNHTQYKIIEARAEHAPFLGRCVACAIGDELCSTLAGSHASAAEAFVRLAQRPDSQYSYRNALVAIDADDRPVGGCIFYDGSHLKSLRAAAAEMFLNEFGFDISSGGDETAPGELYLDTLFVEPSHRHIGIASALIRHVVQAAEEQGIPAGLLVDHDNESALRLYWQNGFTIVGERPFAGTEMHHMQTPNTPNRAVLQKN